MSNSQFSSDYEPESSHLDENWDMSGANASPVGRSHQDIEH
jgi:hypothetical protein